MKYCFVFNYQRGTMAIKSLILINSLRKRLRVENDIIGMTNESMCGPMNPALKKRMRDLGVKLVNISNPLYKNDFVNIKDIKDYIDSKYKKPRNELAFHKMLTALYANKMAIGDLKINADKLVFLDSDIILMNEFEHDKRFEDYNYSGRLDDKQHQPDKYWLKMFSTLGINKPKKIKNYKNVEVYPYFNSGVIFLNSELAPMFFKHWAKNCMIAWRLIKKEPFGWLSEQWSISITLLELGLSVDVLDIKYNQFITDSDPHTIFFHYHHPKFLIECNLQEYVYEAMDDLPYLEEMMYDDEVWSEFLKIDGKVT